MPTRLAACDPCRVSKLACDHERPVCSRCRDAGRAAECTYRSRPFKKRKFSALSEIQQQATSSTHESATLPRATSRRSNYPNPGYLGNSSHATIFNHLSPEQRSESQRASNSTHTAPGDDSAVMADDIHISHGAITIGQIHRSIRIEFSKKLVETWVSKGINLALAGPFTQICTQSAEYILNLCTTTEAMNISRDLFICSLRSLPVHENTTFEELAASFSYANARWETLGFFFVAAARATTDIPIFEPLYSTEQERRSFQKLCMQHSDRCLEISLSLDCLNDLQLWLQYENFICHSYVDGDQSYQTWRKLGDVAGSLLALGYHEQLEHKVPIPDFLRNLRRAAFARTYSADKNVSIFLGRPPRINRKFCRISETIETADRDITVGGAELPPRRPFDYMIDTAWSFNCAILKERTLELSRDESSDERSRLLRCIENDAEAQWQSLPAHFRLEGVLRLNDRDPVERDFMVSAKLNYLHVLLLVRLALARRIPEPDPQLLAISASMLSLTVEALILKHHLVNSGTGLVWKVAYYGLPAAGIICLSLLNQLVPIENAAIDISKVFRDLSVLVAEVEAGALVRIEEPNFALLAEATRAIKSILDRNVFIEGRNTTQAQSLEANQGLTAQEEFDWFPWANIDAWDFERDFWLNLAEHPTLAATEHDPNEFQT